MRVAMVILAVQNDQLEQPVLIHCVALPKPRARCDLASFVASSRLEFWLVDGG